MGQQPLKNVLLIGASGQLAPHLIRELSTSPHLALTVLSRSTPASTPQNTRFITLAAPYQSEELAGCLKGMDAVINLIPAGRIEMHKTVIDLCVKQGVKRYIPPDFGARSDNDTVVERVPVVAMKKRVTEYLQTKETEGLAWTSVICGAFLDSGIKNGFLGFDLKNKKAGLYDEGEHDFDLTLLSDVGKAVASTLADRSAETENRYVHVNTFFASQNSILAALTSLLGEFEVSRVGAQKANESGTARIKNFDFGGAKDSLMGMMASGINGVNGKGKDNELLLGRRTREVRELEKVVEGAVREGYLD